MRVRFIENPLCNGQTWMTGLEEGTDPPDLFPIGPFLGDLLRQVGETDQIFLGGISQEGKRTYCKFFYGVSFGSLVEIHSVPHQSRLRRKSLQTSHVSVTGLKWLELLPSIFCRLIGTDNTPNPFLQTLMKLPGHPVRTGTFRSSIHHRKKLLRDTAASARWSPTGKARGPSMFFGEIRRSIPSYAQGFGGLSSSHSSTAIGRGLLRRRIKRRKK